MTTRADISDSLIHFTRGANRDEALAKLIEIARSGVILGGNGYIKGGYRCVCLTEAPLPAVAGELLNDDSFTRYSPFGVLLPKEHVFSHGGRPVIYQTDGEFEQLPETARWRHVRYEQTAEPPIDFTWERGGRVQCDVLPISPAEAVLVLPDPEWLNHFQAAWHADQEIELESYVTILDRLVLEQMKQPFPWRVVCLTE
jgi:hypothetical protein